MSCCAYLHVNMKQTTRLHEFFLRCDNDLYHGVEKIHVR